MAVAERDAQLAADLEAARRSDGRKAMLLVGAILVVGGLTVATDATPALAGAIPAIGRLAVALLGVLGGTLLVTQPRRGWYLALAWALVQVPFIAWTPDGSPTAQVLQMPVAMTNAVRVNGQLVSYSALGVNVVGVLFAAWLGRWRSAFDR